MKEHYYIAYEEYLNQSTPERRLFAAILARAIVDLIGNDKNQSRNAVQWFECENQEGGISFCLVCDVLELGEFYIERIQLLIHQVEGHKEQTVVNKFRRGRVMT